MTQNIDLKDPVPIAVDDPLQPYGLFVSTSPQRRERSPQPEVWFGETLFFLAPAFVTLALMVWFILH